MEAKKTISAKFEESHPFFYAVTVVALGVFLGGLGLMAATHFAKPLLAATMGKKEKGSSSSASTATAPTASTITTDSTVTGTTQSV